MAINGAEKEAERRVAELAAEIIRIQKVGWDLNQKTADEAVMAAEAPVEKTQTNGRVPDSVGLETDEPRGADAGRAHEAGRELALTPLINKIAHGFARGLVVALKELEDHIARETNKVGDSVDRRLDSFQSCLQDLAAVVSEQRSTSLSVQGRCQQLEVATASLQESSARLEADLATLRGETKDLSASVSERIAAATGPLQETDARHDADLAALRSETRESSTSISERVDSLVKELAVQQEDLAAIKSALGNFSSRVDMVTERLDRQAEALRSMYDSYSRRETEFEQLVEGLAKLRAFPAAAPTNRL